MPYYVGARKYLGFDSHSLPLIWSNHRLAVLLVKILVEHRSGVQILTQTKLLVCFAQNKKRPYGLFLSVGARGLEPPASWSQTKRSSQLSYAPIFNFQFSISNF